MGSPQDPLGVTIGLICTNTFEEYDFKTSNWCECKNICWHHLFKKKKKKAVCSRKPYTSCFSFFPLSFLVPLFLLLLYDILCEGRPLWTTVWRQPLVVPASIKQCGYQAPRLSVLILNLELFFPSLSTPCKCL